MSWLPCACVLYCECSENDQNAAACDSTEVSSVEEMGELCEVCMNVSQVPYFSFWTDNDDICWLMKVNHTEKYIFHATITLIFSRNEDNLQ